MNFEMKATFLIVLMSLGFPGLTYSAETLRYEPSAVNLRGKLLLQEFPGPPGYESIAQGDKSERFWILALMSPVRIVASPENELMETQENVKEVQLVCFTGCGERFSFSAGEVVTLSGTLFSAHSGHHHKSVLMTVNKRME
jgi:hypothetical protein